ncbi:DUF3370 domain-containing protein [Oculatella sp. LEGE 06141]|uniref:DUF3370 domain-containing protein n=1 Tax=Oculatella sp. LEGE 06141 TaxID=1828648 RepID=UPI00187EB2CE|nr:DUF3370 domain-containing protein [Oculatella sp. LEGE 06141]MBE9180815.1 DUF3370 domain-containing protein [Oculatella sp. LEGE 06141]
MLTFLVFFPFAQITLPTPPAVNTPPPTIRRTEVVQSHEVRSLPGQLDEVPVFNSNSPELIQSEGILLSTFPPDGKRSPAAHLDFSFEGRFDIFAHHVARGVNAADTRTRYLGIVLYNPGRAPVTVDVLQAVSYLSQEAPFHDLPPYVANPLGTVYSGPGSRTTNDILRGQRQPYFPAHVVIPPRRTYLLVNSPIPLRRLNYSPVNGAILPDPTPLIPSANAATPPSSNGDVNSTSASENETLRLNRPIPINGRSLLMHLSSDGPVYVASLTMPAPLILGGGERAPSQAEWQALLEQGQLAEPRDRPPTLPNVRSIERYYYGRVAGVAQGSQWEAQLTDSPQSDRLSIPSPGDAFSYVLSTVDRNTFGTGQIQSAPLLTRYPDTAYRAHGNYGIQYNLRLPLYNNTDETQTVELLFQTPLQNEQPQGNLRFLDPPDDRIFFRGTVRLRYNDDLGISQTRYLHLVQRRGQQGQPLMRLNVPRGDRRLVQVEFLYPPDATPPQVLTVRTLDRPRDGFSSTDTSRPGVTPEIVEQPE